MTSQVYDTDFLRWTEEQAALLRAGESVAVIAERLGKAPQTLYKTIRTANLHDVTGFLIAVETLLDQVLQGAEP